MKKAALTLIYFIQRWVLILSIALSPLQARGDAANDNLPAANDNEKISHEQSGVKIVEADGTEDLSKLRASEPTQIDRPELKEKVTK